MLFLVISVKYKYNFGDISYKLYIILTNLNVINIRTTFLRISKDKTSICVHSIDCLEMEIRSSASSEFGLDLG